MDKKLILSIVTPQEVYLEEIPVDFVALPAFEGEMGILPGHAPFMVQLKDGLLRYRTNAEESVFAILGGFAQIENDRVTILAEGADLAKEIDEEKERQAYQRARDALAMKGADIDLDAAQAALRKAALRMKIAELRRKRRK